ncbi:MAG: hypothetical protein K6G51_03980 [Sphaerochaetaceae bacterium]|nr:hypothetical protein [Sphaerochaetaceae bacterium]
MRKIVLILAVLLLTISILPAVSFYDRLSGGVNEGHTRNINDNLNFRTSFLVDNRAGAEFKINSKLSTIPFALIRYSSKTLSAPMITLKSHFDLGIGAGLYYALSNHFRLNADIYTGFGFYFNTETKLAFIGCNLGMEYLFNKNFFISPQVQLERASYQDSVAVTLGLGVRI